jgi:uncharacterized protein
MSAPERSELAAGQTPGHTPEHTPGLVARALRGLIRVYQLVLSPLLGTNCRYHPSCSEYAREAVLLHGPLRGTWLALRRMGRCHPWGGHGHDPVPPRR